MYRNDSRMYRMYVLMGIIIEIVSFVVGCYWTYTSLPLVAEWGVQPLIIVIYCRFISLIISGYVAILVVSVVWLILECLLCCIFGSAPCFRCGGKDWDYEYLDRVYSTTFPQAIEVKYICRQCGMETYESPSHLPPCRS